MQPRIQVGFVLIVGAISGYAILGVAGLWLAVGTLFIVFALWQTHYGTEIPEWALAGGDPRASGLYGAALLFLGLAAGDLLSAPYRLYAQIVGALLILLAFSVALRIRHRRDEDAANVLVEMLATNFKQRVVPPCAVNESE